MQWLTNEQISQRVLKTAHRRFKSPFNKLSWTECVKDSWAVMNLLLRSRAIRRLKLFVPEKENPYKSKNPGPDYSFMDPAELGYGIGHYCGD